MVAAVFAAAATIGAEYVGAMVLGEAFVLSNALIAKAAFSAGMSLISESLQEAPAQTQSPITSEIAARKQLIRTSAAPRRAIYGEVGRVSGNLLYVANGADPAYVHFVIALAGHRCQAINASYLGDELVGDLDVDGNVTTGRFAGYVRIRKYLGTADQVMDALLAAECPEWGAKNRPGKGITYVYLRIKRSRDVFPQGIPTPRFDVLGKADILDVRTSTVGYTNNAALCTLDYVLWKHGFKSDLDEVVQSTWIAAANTCDEDVALPAAAGGGTQKRYAINGSFTLDRGRAEVLDQMRQAMAGAVNYTMGQWYGHAGAADTPVMDISEADLRGGYRIRPRVPDDKVYNAVKGTFTETAFDTETDFPPVTNPVYEAQDGGQSLYKDVKLPFENNAYRAQRLVKIDLERHRQGIVVELPMRIKSLKLRPWNIVRLSLATPGFSNKLFRVIGWKFSLFGGADLVLEEYADAIYTWSSLEATLVDPAPDTNLQSPAVVLAPGAPAITETPYETTGSAGVKSCADVVWTSVDPYARWQRLAYRPSGGDWITIPDQIDASIALNDLAPGMYEFKAATINAFGVPSPWSAVTTKEILGLTADPADVTGFSVMAFNGAANGQWNLTPDLDVKIGGRVFIRWTPMTVGAVWENGIDVRDFNGDATNGPLPMLTGTYLAKFRDSSQNWSNAAAAFVLTAGALTALPNSLTVTEHATFAGVKSGTVAIDGVLKLDSAGTLDSMTALIDSWGYLDSIGGTQPAGTYSFSAAMDFGSVVTRRITPNILAQAFDTGDMIDSRGMVDDWDSVDGTAVNDATATLLASLSQDDVSWGPWVPLLAGDVTCRSIKFRLDLASAQPTHNIQISQLAATANW
jgi:hypothetical protein